MLIGTNVEICDSDFHTIYPKQRNDKNHLRNPVELGENCWIGSNVKILKGVKLGENVVVSNGSVVTKSFGPNLVIGGVPATILKTISEN